MLTKQLLLALVLLGPLGCAGRRPRDPRCSRARSSRWRAGPSRPAPSQARRASRSRSERAGVYRVLDRSGRWLGHADATGRFSRRVPFRDEEQDLGVWSLERGCRMLFEREDAVQLTPQQASAVEAVFQRGR